MKKCNWKKVIQLAGAIVLGFYFSCLTTSCSESDEEKSEFDNWQERNETYFNEVYNRAKNSSSSEWAVYTKWSLNDDVAANPKDHIVVQVLERGTGSGCPLYTDSVRIHYSGRLMPTASYAQGYEFDKSWTDSYNPAVSKPLTSVVNGFVDGFSTAIMNMHIGDRWRVYIPYQLGYGTTASGSVPAYSTLIFDLTLVAYNHPGAGVPNW